MQIYVFEHDVKSIEAVDDGTDKRIRFNGEPGVTLFTLWVSKETARALQAALDKLYPVEDDVVNAVDAYAEAHAGDAATACGGDEAAEEGRNA